MKKALAYTTMIITSLTICSCGGGGSDDSPGGDLKTNNPPSISGVPEDSVRVGEEYVFHPSAMDTDNDELTFSATNLPVWLHFDESTGSLTGIPSNGDVGSAENIQITVSDGVEEDQLAAFAISILPPGISQENLQALGEIIPTELGYESVGDLVMTFADGQTRTFRDADLQLEFDDRGNLSDMFGETIIPTDASPKVALDGEYRANISVKWGKEINEDDFYDVDLKPQRQYLVYELGTEVNIVVGNKEGEEKQDRLTIGTPASGKLILIEDPFDPMLYVYGEIPFVGAGGTGSSSEGLLPFVPLLSNDEIKEFDGQELITGSIDLGIKFVDLLNFSGTRIEKKPQLSSLVDEIDYSDPFESTIEYKVGMNGSMDFAFGVLGFGLFSFDLADASGMLDVGFDHQSLAIRSIVDPDMEWAPQWMTFVADSDLDANFILTGEGTLDMWLTGTYVSTLPKANVTGTIHADLNSVTLSGQVVDRITVPLSVTFIDNEIRGEVGINVDYASEINSSVDAGFDRAEQTYEDAKKELTDAIADYEFEVSLRGLREQIPGIVDLVVPKLEAIPSQLRTSVDAAVVKAIQDKKVCKTVTILGKDITKCFYAKDYVNEASIGDDAGKYARDESQKRIKPYLDMLAELKFRAQQADAEEFRALLEKALREAYKNRNIDTSYTYSKSLGSFDVKISGIGVSIDFGKVSKTIHVSQQIFTPDQASAILFAADNIYRIDETDSYVVSTNDFLDSLPEPSTIASVREQVQNGVKQVPNVESIKYVVAGGSYTATVAFSDGSERNVEVNVLDVDLTIDAIGDLLAHYVLEE